MARNLTIYSPKFTNNCKENTTSRDSMSIKLIYSAADRRPWDFLRNSLVKCQRTISEEWFWWGKARWDTELGTRRRRKCQSALKSGKLVQGWVVQSDSQSHTFSGTYRCRRQSWVEKERTTGKQFRMCWRIEDQIVDPSTREDRQWLWIAFVSMKTYSG